MPVSDRACSPPAHALDAVVRADPFAYYRQLREERPLYFDAQLGLWVASSHAVIEAAFHSRALVVRPIAEPVPTVLQGTAAADVFELLVRMTDGAFHAAHKPAVARMAACWSLADVARASHASAADLQPDLPANELMHRLPVRTVARLLGVPHALLDESCSRVQQFVSGIAPGAGALAVAQAAEAASVLMAQSKALGLEPVQAANRIGLMQQARDATAGLIGLTATMLANEPALAAAADRSLDAMRDFVAEVERHQAPIQNTRRFAAEALMLAGCAIRAGQGVLLVLASANRDETLNPQPDRFDPQRSGRRSMGFGAGAHACPGAAFAIEIAAAFSRYTRASGQFDSYFGRPAGFRPLTNARIPVFAN